MISILLRLSLALVLLAAGLVGYVYLAPESALESLTKVSRWRAGLQRAEIDVDGIRVAYLDGGHGEPLVLLHGFGGAKDSFTRVSRYLAPHYRIIAPDVPGFGESDKPLDLDYSVDAIVDRLHAFVRKLGITRFALGGNSMGGFIAAAYAVKYPADVTSLWLLAPGGITSAPPSALAARNAAEGKTLAVRTPEDFRSQVNAVTAKPMKIPGPFLDVLAKRAVRDQAVQAKALAGIMGSPSLEETANGLATPALIVFGDQDQVINPAAAGIAHRLLPNSQVRIMHEVGHLPMAEAPAEAAADYLAFRAVRR